ncbi:hypothetical protein SAMN04515668_1481 [Hymenobacter arizonensis]|uniref:Uncharacterized protein n=2 Tax=Hymenobacter arizonensis TaxID=1227077 RepID=A0A1I5WT94_HYMAR|nr:hypothetical protein SAMN04515668_1481 [Hymenobacter arizonensis]
MGWAAGLILSEPDHKYLGVFEPAWRQAAALAARTAPRVQAGKLLGYFRVRLLRATLSPNAP